MLIPISTVLVANPFGRLCLFLLQAKTAIRINPSCGFSRLHPFPRDVPTQNDLSTSQNGSFLILETKRQELEMRAVPAGKLRREYPELTLELDTELIRQEIRWSLEIQCRVEIQQSRAAVIVPTVDCLVVVISPTKIDEDGNPHWFSYVTFVDPRTRERSKGHTINATVKVIDHRRDQAQEIYSRIIVKREMRDVLNLVTEECLERGYALKFAHKKLSADE
jgi:hypothetical protein